MTFDKGCHQPWSAEFILANYLVVRNDGGDRMRIVRCCDHPTGHSVLIQYTNGETVYFDSLDEAMATPMGRSVELWKYLEDALAIRKEEYAS